MNSNDLSTNLKYYGKFLTILIIIFLLLKFLMNIKLYEALLLSIIITVSMLIIENIIQIDEIITDPLNCNQCKISSVEINKSDQIDKSNQIKYDVLSEQINEYDKLKKLYEQLRTDTDVLKSQQTETKPIISNEIEGFNNINELDKFINDQENQNQNLTNKLKSNPNIHANLNKIKNTINEQQNTQTSQTSQKDILEHPYLARADLLGKTEQSNTSIAKTNANDKNDLDMPITYDASYVEYQQNGEQKQADDTSFNNALFKMGIGQQNIVKPFIRDGSDYYKKIQSYSSKSPTSSEALNSELKYGDYNYIGPLNSGMTNSDYTFISPNNWFPVQPHPPVCVTNKQCTTCPIMISNGQDYMNWANLEDFDKSRRFTGNMGINIDYVKNVLNNDEGY